MTGIDMASFYSKICPLIIRQHCEVYVQEDVLIECACVLEWRKEKYYTEQLYSYWLEAGLICHEYQDYPTGYSTW